MRRLNPTVHAQVRTLFTGLRPRPWLGPRACRVINAAAPMAAVRPGAVSRTGGHTSTTEPTEPTEPTERIHDALRRLTSRTCHT